MFSSMYTSWWGNLAASAAGAAVAEKLYYEPAATHAGGCAPLVYAGLMLLWLCVGVWAAEAGGAWAAVLYTVLARPVAALLLAGMLRALCRHYRGERPSVAQTSLYSRVFMCVCVTGGVLRGRWAAGARFVSRVSLGVSLLHWPLNMSVVALRGGDVAWLWDSALVWTGAVGGAAALTVLLQYPAQNTLRLLLPRYF